MDVTNEIYTEHPIKAVKVIHFLKKSGVVIEEG